MAIQVLEYHHGLEPQSVWRMVNSNQFAPVAMPEKSIPYVQELGDFYASSSFYTKRHSLVSYLLKYTVSGEGVLEYGDSRYTLRADDVFWIDCQKQQYYYTAPDTGHWHLCSGCTSGAKRARGITSCSCCRTRARPSSRLRATRRCSRSSRGFWPPIPSRAPTSCVTFRPPARSPAF